MGYKKDVEKYQQLGFIKAEETPTTIPTIEETTLPYLPPEIWKKIFEYQSRHDLVRNVKRVCTRFHELATAVEDGMPPCFDCLWGYSQTTGTAFDFEKMFTL